MPTKPPLEMRRRSIPLVLAASVSAAGKKKPVLVSPARAMDAAPALPCANSAVPAKVAVLLKLLVPVTVSAVPLALENAAPPLKVARPLKPLVPDTDSVSVLRPLLTVNPPFARICPENCATPSAVKRATSAAFVFTTKSA